MRGIVGQVFLRFIAGGGSQQREGGAPSGLEPQSNSSDLPAVQLAYVKTDAVTGNIDAALAGRGGDQVDAGRQSIADEHSSGWLRSGVGHIQRASNLLADGDGIGDNACTESKIVHRGNHERAAEAGVSIEIVGEQSGRRAEALHGQRSRPNSIGEVAREGRLDRNRAVELQLDVRCVVSGVSIRRRAGPIQWIAVAAIRLVIECAL